MNEKQLERMHTAKGFIAALDQSGGSTPKALERYGIKQDQFHNDEEMFHLVHQMRSRIITSPAFTSQQILGAILFENTMDREIEGQLTADYLWDVKGVVPFLKVDKGLADLKDGVQLMKPMPGLDELLERAKERHIFGTKMRSVIQEANPSSIQKIVDQQFELGLQIAKAGLVPILEPEVDINSPDKEQSETLLKEEIQKHLKKLASDTKLMFKLSIPSVDGFYSDLMKDSRVVRVVALSGGYDRKDANERLSRNAGLIASFSRALSEGLSQQQTDEEFNDLLSESIHSIYLASTR